MAVAVRPDVVPEPATHQPRPGGAPQPGRRIGTEYFIEHVRQQLLEYGFTDDRSTAAACGSTPPSTTRPAGRLRRRRHTLDRRDDPHAALVAIDANGYVRAMMAGRDFEAASSTSPLATFSGGVGRRPGSSMKPFVLAQALEQDISLNSRFDSPGSMTFPDVRRTPARPGGSATTAAPSRASSASSTPPGCRRTPCSPSS